jgi:hypothetical protein
MGNTYQTISIDPSDMIWFARMWRLIKPSRTIIRVNMAGVSGTFPVPSACDVTLDPDDGDRCSHWNVCHF